MLFRGGTAEAASWSIPIDVTTSAEPGTIEIVGTHVPDTTALAPGEQLRRPDGKEPPDSIALEVPQAAPQRSGFVTVLARERGLAMSAPPGSGELVSPHSALRIAGRGRAAVLHDPVAATPTPGNPAEDATEPVGPTSADELRPAQGEEFVVARVEELTSGVRAATVVEEGVGFGDSPDVRYVVRVGERRTALDAPPQPGHVIVASVPRGSEDVWLEVSDESRAQSVNLVTGRQGPDAFAPYYRGRPNSVDLGRQYRGTASVLGDVRVEGTAYLRAAVLAGYDPTAGWAPDGQSWLAITVEDLDWTTDSFLVQTPLEARRSAVLQVGRSGYRPEDTLFTEDGGDRLLFRVPESFTSGTLHFQPVFMASGPAGSQLGTLTPRLTIPIRLP